MSTPIDRFDPTTIHTLDVAFSSDATPVNSVNPIAMAYGFAYGTSDTSWSSVAAGQMKETLKHNQKVYFKIFDTAQKLVTLSKVLITFEDNKSPFSWSSRSFPGDEELPHRRSISIHGPGLGSTDWSYGCNVVGTEWFCGPYHAVNLGDFECTIWVWVKMADGQEKVFNVDPEIIVEGGN